MEETVYDAFVVMQKNERRLFPRSPLKLSVSFCPEEVRQGTEEWHFGEIKDASMGGLQIHYFAPVELSVDTYIELCCMPAVDRYRSRPQKPVRIKGRVVWQCPEEQLLGISYV